MIPAAIKIRIVLGIRFPKYEREIKHLFPCPRQEDLIALDLLPWTWKEILYGSPLYHPNFCLNCHSHLGACIGGKITASCSHCQGKDEHSAFNSNRANQIKFMLGYSLGYCPELIDLLIGEFSKGLKSPLELEL